MTRRIFLPVIGLCAMMIGPSAFSQHAQTQSVTRGGAAEDSDWDAQRLDALLAYTATLSTDAFLIVSKGRTVAAFGDLETVRPTHSIRKALLSALVGQHAGPGPGPLQLEATLGALGIDDFPTALTETQKRATVGHLLESRSGINRPAAAEAGLTAEKNRRLGDGDNEPGSVWAYNNWDYNALTTVFERRTGLSVAEAFMTGIARPSGMEDFGPGAVSYVEEPALSQHRAASFRMSARDLARFGQLYLNDGRWNGEPIVPARWIERITSEFSKTGRNDLRWGHGDLWWIPSPDFGFPEGTFWAWGLGNQAVFVIPAWDTVIVHQSDTGEFLKRFRALSAPGGRSTESVLEELILSCLDPAQRNSEYCTQHRFTTRREFETLMSLVIEARL